MPSLTSRAGFLGAVAIGTLVVAWILAEVPRLRLAGTSVPTQFVVGAVAGLLTLGVAVSELRDGDRRSALQFGLLGVGVPLALSGWGVVASVGAALCLLGAAVAWGLDHRIHRRFTNPR